MTLRSRLSDNALYLFRSADPCDRIGELPPWRLQSMLEQIALLAEVAQPDDCVFIEMANTFIRLETDSASRENLSSLCLYVIDLLIHRKLLTVDAYHARRVLHDEACHKYAALAAARAAVRLYPMDSEAWACLAFLTLGYGFPLEEALRCLDKAIELNPSSMYFAERSEIMLFLGRYREAIDDLSTAIAQCPIPDFREWYRWKRAEAVQAMLDGSNIKAEITWPLDPRCRSPRSGSGTHKLWRREFLRLMHFSGDRARYQAREFKRFRHAADSLTIEVSHHVIIADMRRRIPYWDWL